MSDKTVTLNYRPDCDMCGKLAYYDAKINGGPWAYLCKADFHAYGIGLGIGRGQRIVVKPE